MSNKQQVLDNAVKRCREKNIIIPTFDEIIDLVPETINNELDRWIPYNINYQRFNINNFSKLFI